VIRLRLWLVALTCALWLLLGCSKRDAGDDAPPPVDTELMAFLSEARALHHQANLREEMGELDRAIEAMERLVSAEKPRGASTPEVDEVLADTYARLAELRLRNGELEAAGDAAARGLTHAPNPTYFRGHLIEVQGLVEEARASEAADAGLADAASEARQRAIDLLEEVVRIQEQVIQRSLANREAGAEAGR
jgi:tetratricopeptide (TPR) repeat protein